MSVGRRVVVTGLGVVTPIGLDERTMWSSLIEGHTGLAELRRFDASGNEVRNGAEVDFSILDERQKGKLRRADRAVRMMLEAGRQALAQAGRLSEPPYEQQAVSTVLGSAGGPLETLDSLYQRFADKGPKGMRPSSVPNAMINAVSGALALEFKLAGTNQAIVSACTSATNAIGHAFRLIRHGYAEAVLTGGTDSPFNPFYYGIWNNLGVFSRIPDPKLAVRPFAADRQGTLLGEGAGALLLESLEEAERRGVQPRGEIIGYGESSNVQHVTAPEVEGQARSIRAALEDARVGADEIGYVNAHGTATPSNDVIESEAIRQAFGPAAAESTRVGSNKSFFGHTLGASGAIESIATLLGLEARVVPPNLNLETPDPECRVGLVGGQPMEILSPLAIQNSFGFGGGNGVLVFRRFV